MSPQGKRQRTAKPAPKRSAGLRRAALAVFAVFLVGAFVWVAAAEGLGTPSIPDDAIAVVEDAPDGTITREDFDAAMEQTAAAQGLRKVPEEGDEQYDAIKQAAVDDLLLARWVMGEGEERGIEITEREIDQELDEVKRTQFGSQRAFDRFLKQNGFTPEQARERIKLQLISERIQEEVLPSDQEPDVPEDQIEAYYDENISQFEQPETRDVRVVLAENEGDAEKALSELQKDDSKKSWDRVAKQFSTDEATKNSGGLREAVIQGQSEAALDEEIFNAPEGELVGPFEGESGSYVIQVESITPARTTPLDEARDQIAQTIAGAEQQAIADTFQQDFQEKWIKRSFCAEGYQTNQCANAPTPPNPCTKEVAESDGCDAPVASRPVFQPGTATVPGGVAPTLVPQGPITPQSAAPAEGQLPPGLESLPPGTVPPGQGGAPPGTTP